MSDSPTPNEPPRDGKPGAKKGNWGFVEWGIVLAILGLVIYGQFFGGGPC